MKPKAVFLRTAYNYDTNAASNETGIDTGTEGGAKQSFKDEVDINTILKRFGVGYEMPATPRVPMQGDFTHITDFQSAQNAIVKAREMFDEYPAHIRSKFDNDPRKFTEFCLDPENREEMKELGLLSKEAIQRDLEAAEKAKQQTKGEDKAPPKDAPKAK